MKGSQESRGFCAEQNSGFPRCPRTALQIVKPDFENWFSWRKDPPSVWARGLLDGEGMNRNSGLTTLSDSSIALSEDEKKLVKVKARKSYRNLMVWEPRKKRWSQLLYYIRNTSLIIKYLLACTSYIVYVHLQSTCNEVFIMTFERGNNNTY